MMVASMTILKDAILGMAWSADLPETYLIFFVSHRFASFPYFS